MVARRGLKARQHRSRASAGPVAAGCLKLAAFPYETPPMAKPNYSFEKRQREIAKKKKQDEKLAKKQAAKDEANPPTEHAVDDKAPTGQ